MIGKQLIEKQEVFGQVTEADDYVLLDQKSHKICAPEDNECYSIVLWTKYGPNDNSLSAIKIVFYFFKNLMLIWFVIPVW